MSAISSGQSLGPESSILKIKGTELQQTISELYVEMLAYYAHPFFLESELGSNEFDDNWQGGFFCPCHGSKFDLAGRVYSGVPAPTNMSVPPHYYESENILVIGEDGELT